MNYTELVKSEFLLFLFIRNEASYFKGACTEYNIVGGVVQPQRSLNCTNGNPPCPIRYKSTEAYLCKYNHLNISSLLR